MWQSKLKIKGNSCVVNKINQRQQFHYLTVNAINCFGLHLEPEQMAVPSFIVLPKKLKLLFVLFFTVEYTCTYNAYTISSFLFSYFIN